MAYTELEERLRRAAADRAGHARLAHLPAGAIVAAVRRRAARRRAVVGGCAALVLGAAACAWWPMADRGGARPPRPAGSIAIAGAPADGDDRSLTELLLRIETQRRRVEVLQSAERCTEYRNKLAGRTGVDDPLRAARVALEEAAWSMFDEVERGADEGAPAGERRAGYARVSKAMPETYWGGMAEQRLRELTGDSGT